MPASDRRRRIRRRANPEADAPFHGEVLSVERLAEHAEALADNHEIATGSGHERNLLSRLEENYERLVEGYETLADAARDGDQMTPAAEWLIDNFHIVEEQSREVRHDLPRKFYRELPKLASGELRGYPRIYHLGLHLVAHTDNRIDLETLQRFVAAYQHRKPLLIGEIWAIPIALRLALIENLRRYVDMTIDSRQDLLAADRLADRLAGAEGDEFPADLLGVVSSTFESENLRADFAPAYFAQLAARLREGNRMMTYALELIERKLRREGETIEHLTHLEHNRQAASQVSVGNIITSMRLLSTLDWREFFEEVSLVDRELRRDPAGAYRAMDFETRDAYRHEIERVARKTDTSEIEIAKLAVRLATELGEDGKQPESAQKQHVGYLLATDDGLRLLERSLDNYRPRLSESVRRSLRAHPTFFYVGSIIVLSALFSAAISYPVSRGYSPWVFAGAFALLFTPAGELATTLVNWLVTVVFTPRRLPKMDFRNGVPRRARTMVVIPTLLTDADAIDEIFEKIEKYYLANRDDQIFFALLGDLTDACSETTDDDEILRETARARCRALNEKYGKRGRRTIFHFFSRGREWSKSEEIWICCERKRGNLHEFNRLLRGESETRFADISAAERRLLATIKYVITLDADTQLPRDTAQKLVGTIEHPLNRPVFDEAQRRVVSGYGILQPRIEISLPSAFRSPFARIYSGSKGFDPYTLAVSDVYQDLFGEGNYVGKGLYDVDAFEAALERRVPKDMLLSHDLFEGLFARTALVSDIAFYDDYPSGYEPFARRLHRWTRGDWQIFRWVWPFVPDMTGSKVRNTLPLIARWKILDNLRRSLVAPSVLLVLICVWTFLPLFSVGATLFVIVAMTAPLYLQLARLPVREPAVGFWKSQKLEFLNVVHDMRTTALQLFLRLTFLVDEAFNSIDAIIRVAHRKLVSGKRLLEWVTAAESDRNSHGSLSEYLRSMALSPVASVVIGTIVRIYYPAKIEEAAPLLMVWLVAPLIAFWTSLETKERPPADEISVADRESLRLYARRTWRYFEEFVGESGHWLPPDNFQEDPVPVAAHRTSPTNIGMLLLSTLAARDLGYLGTLETIERIELTCMTLERLQRFRGHFLNWYDTQTLAPLNPQYVSTVDSGNLAGHLIAVAEGCLEIPDAPIFGERTRNGLTDTLRILKNEAATAFRDETALRREIDNAAAIVAELPPEGETARWRAILGRLADASDRIGQAIAGLADGRDVTDVTFWNNAVRHLVANSQRDAAMLIPSSGEDSRSAEMLDNLRLRADGIARFCRRLADEMDFGFLYDSERKVLTIGYRPTDGVRDNSFYDLLASEARLASFVAIMTGDIEQQHWFRLGRGIVGRGSTRALVSWSGTMFEYLMPLLVMKDYRGTLLSETYHSIVRKQIEYGLESGTAWGVSESAYNARDLQLNYQYGPFGVPGLGLKRGLAEDLVVSPYATFLALPFAPEPAVRNIRRLVGEGLLGRYGFYEAIDYTKDRLPPDQTSARIESYMSHHQGMILVALDNFLNDNVMVARFHREPMVESAELLLQERVPRLGPEQRRPRAATVASGRRGHALVAPAPRRFGPEDRFSPQVCLLSNGSYSVMLTNAGSGFSRRGEIAVTRWREDAVRDDRGTFFYLRDLGSGAVWSAGLQPVLRETADYEAVFTESKATFKRRDAGITTRTEIIIATEEDAELRRLTLTNELNYEREIEITSYLEVVLAPQAADEAHPAFSNLFVETEHDPARGLLIARRRPRSADDPEIWAGHLVRVDGDGAHGFDFETDRGRFVGRGRSTLDPAGLGDGQFARTTGATLDPIFALRVRVAVGPGDSIGVTYATFVADSRAGLLGIADRVRRPDSFGQIEKLAWTRSQVELRHLGVTAEEANVFQRLAGHLIYANPQMRPRPEVLALNRGSPQTLWKYGIGGDLPIMIVRIGDRKDMARTVGRILRGHDYLRLKGLRFDLVIFNDQPTTYAPGIGEELLNLIRRSALHSSINKAGGVFIRRSDEMPDEDRIALHAAARVMFVADRGTLDEQLRRRPAAPELPRMLIPSEPSRRYPPPPEPTVELEFKNRYGGFADRGREYRIELNEQNGTTPAPWANVIANERGFGMITTESGIATTWSMNSQENRLTPWNNDPVRGAPSASIYLRDEMSGSFWTPTALPIRESAPYVIRHGSGYTLFEHASHGIEQQLTVFAAVDSDVSVKVLRLKNVTRRRRRLSATFHADMVLGTERARSARFLVSEIDAVTGAVFFTNSYSSDFRDRVAFAACGAPERTWTCDRREFIGRNGDPTRPAAMFRGKLSGAVGAGLDPCAAVRAVVELEPDEEREIVFLLGEAESRDDARVAVARFGNTVSAERELDAVKAKWDAILGCVAIETPDRALDILVNRWLPYQNLSCRFWARTSVYQSSGAYGFRDQLQDSMALVYSRPDLAREHILRAAGRQFREGDVQHWWHLPSGEGTRTRISDNLLWLVYVACFYARVTGDASVFDAEVNFIDAAVPAEGEADVFVVPTVLVESAPLFEHCRRALDRSLETGAHGLPLIGAGDWSDGLNRVGLGGKGESVWLGWFLYSSLTQFAGVCDRRRMNAEAERYRDRAARLSRDLNRTAWDGDWYLRAFYDDGTPLGSIKSEECRIDSIAQSWSVISGAGESKRNRIALSSARRRLVRKDEKLVLLLEPPFDKTNRDPGYIKGYPPGIRENGGQYTHAATWLAIALAMSGDGDAAHEIISMINPVSHTGTDAALARYRTEPYVVAADVYANRAQLGRGGWTWYTGAAGWFYRAVVEAILGITLAGDELRVRPVIPASWPSAVVVLRHRGSEHRIEIDNARSGASEIIVDGQPVAGGTVELSRAKGMNIRVIIGEGVGASTLADSAR